MAQSEVLPDIGATLASRASAPEVEKLLGLATSQSTSAQLAFDQLARDTAKALLMAIPDRVGTVEAMRSLGVAAAEHDWSYPRAGKLFCPPADNSF